MFILTLSETECRKTLADNRLARLACAKGKQPYVVPIYYAYAGDHLYAFSLPGRKIEWMRENPLMSVLVEERGHCEEWRSVIVDGRFEELPDRIGHKRERDRAWSLLSRHADWWEPGDLKPVTPPLSKYEPEVFFRISIDRLSGRAAKAA